MKIADSVTFRNLNNITINATQTFHIYNAIICKQPISIYKYAHCLFQLFAFGYKKFLGKVKHFVSRQNNFDKIKSWCSSEKFQTLIIKYYSAAWTEMYPMHVIRLK